MFSITIPFPYCARQKSAQLSLEDHQNLMDSVLAWKWVRPKLLASVDGEMMPKLDDMFAKGCLRQEWGPPMGHPPLKPPKTRHT